MAIQNRRGAYEDFDASKILPGEIAATTDGTDRVYVGFDLGRAEELALKKDLPADDDIQEAVAGYLEENPVKTVSWNDVTDKPFGEESTVLFEWDGDTADLETEDVVIDNTTIPLYKVSDTPLTLEQIVGSTVSGYEVGTAFTITVEESSLTITDTVISSGEIMHSVLSDTTIGDVTLTPGLWAMKFSQTYVTKIIKETVKQLNIQYIPDELYTEIDKRIDAYIEEALGGDY